MTCVLYPLATSILRPGMSRTVRGLCSLVLVLWMAGGLAQGVAAPRMLFDLPAQPLANALIAYGKATGLSILVIARLTADRQSAAVKGLYTPEQALRLLLAGSGLTTRYTSRTAFTLVPVPTHNSIAAPAPAVGAVVAAQLNSRYAARVQRVIGRLLCLLQPDKLGHYRVGLQLWIDTSGQIYRVHLLNSPGLAAWGGTVQAVLERQVVGPPPAGFQQPITLLLRIRQDRRMACRV